MTTAPDAPPRSPRAAFWRSRHHLLFAIATVGVGFATGEPLGLLVGGVLYAIGLVYLPDSGWFRGLLEKRQQQADAAEAAARHTAFAAERDKLIAGLGPAARTRFVELHGVCRDIENASAEVQSGSAPLALETRLRKLDELLWTYLRLLSLEHAMETFLEGERRENLPHQIQLTEGEVTALEPTAAAEQPPGPYARLLQSKRDRLLALRERHTRVGQATAHLELARAEQHRLVDQVKLLRADIVATRNPDALTLRIDQSVEHLAETNRWLGEIADFRDLTAQLPPGTGRLQLDALPASAPPPLHRTRTPQR